MLLVITMTSTLMCALYGMTLQRKYIVYNRVFYSITAALFLLMVMMRPKDNSKRYTIFIYLHFFFFAVLGDAFVVVRHIRQEKWNMLAQELFIIFGLYFPAWWVLLKFRKRLAALPSEELSNYLIDNVIKAGLGALTPMLFLSFDTMSCLLDSGLSVAVEECAALSMIEQYLSFYLYVALVLKLCSQTVPTNVRKQVEIQIYQVASFNKMVLRQRVQCILAFFTIICAIFLISHSGSSYASARNEDVLNWIGAAGALSATVALTLEMRQLIIVHRRIIKFAKSESKWTEAEKKVENRGMNRMSITEFAAM